MWSDPKLLLELAVLAVGLAAAFGALRSQLGQVTRTLERVEAFGASAEQRLAKLEARLMDADGRVAAFWARDWPALVDRLEDVDKRLQHVEQQLAALTARKGRT